MRSKNRRAVAVEEKRGRKAGANRKERTEQPKGEPRVMIAKLKALEVPAVIPSEKRRDKR